MSAAVLPPGFLAAGVACGMKQDPKALDLAMLVSSTPATAAGVFTQNRVVGAPVKVSRSRVPSTTTRAVVINSAIANAGTGNRGIEDAEWMTAEAAAHLGCADTDVLVCSTGVIGDFLPRPLLAAGMTKAAGELGSDESAFAAAAAAMLTTDTVTKQAVRRGMAAGVPITVSGVAKGAAMIRPNLATMLAVVMTDAALDPSQADRLLGEAVAVSFNSITVDGHESTSDTVLLLANGAAGSPVTGGAAGAVGLLITDVCVDLAQQIIRDAEGADHFIAVEVIGLASVEDARRIASAVAESPLVKTAVAGADPNWGRIVSAAGYAGVEFAEEDMSLLVNGTTLYRNGSPVGFDRDRLAADLGDNHDVVIRLEFAIGDTAATMWTSDLTTEYVRLNSEYTT